MPIPAIRGSPFYVNTQCATRSNTQPIHRAYIYASRGKRVKKDFTNAFTHDILHTTQYTVSSSCALLLIFVKATCVVYERHVTWLKLTWQKSLLKDQSCF